MIALFFDGLKIVCESYFKNAFNGKEFSAAFQSLRFFKVF